MQVLKISSKNLVRKIIKLIKEGKVVVCPTDTLYWLLADASNKKAVEKIVKIKKRKQRKAIPIFIKDIKMAESLAFINEKQKAFLKKVWPGKVTVVLKRKDSLPGILFAGKKTIGLRIADYKLISVLLDRLGFPLAETSANISGHPVLVKIERVISQFKNEKFKPDLIIDGGDLKKNLPSTIIDISCPKPKILRGDPGFLKDYGTK